MFSEYILVGNTYVCGKLCEYADIGHCAMAFVGLGCLEGFWHWTQMAAVNLDQVLGYFYLDTLG